VAEDNEDMLGTYAMIDPQGMAYTNLNGRYHYSKQSAVDIGFSIAWRQVMDGFSDIRFENRGGNWDWSHSGISLPIVESSVVTVT
jgi:radical S-adenosyl methionine domain-containing protein 2